MAYDQRLKEYLISAVIDIPCKQTVNGNSRLMFCFSFTVSLVELYNEA